jgi:hypothetical protein
MDMPPPLKYPFFAACRASAVRQCFCIFSNLAAQCETVFNAVVLGGVGRRLVEHLLHRAPQCGITTVLAICFESNAPSCRLFAKMGFERSVGPPPPPPTFFRGALQIVPPQFLLLCFFILINSRRWGLLPECVVMVNASSCRAHVFSCTHILTPLLPGGQDGKCSDTGSQI